MNLCVYWAQPKERTQIHLYGQEDTPTLFKAVVHRPGSPLKPGKSEKSIVFFQNYPNAPFGHDAFCQESSQECAHLFFQKLNKSPIKRLYCQAYTDHVRAELTATSVGY